MARSAYLSDLSDAEYACLAPYLPPRGRRVRAEVPVVLPLPAHRAVLKGKVDLVASDPAVRSAATILERKTGAYARASDQVQALL